MVLSLLLSVSLVKADPSPGAQSATELIAFMAGHEESEVKAEAQAIKLLEKIDFLASKQEATNLISAAFDRGWLSFAKKLISLASANHDVSHIVHSSAQALRQKLNAIVEHAHAASLARVADGATGASQPATPSPIPTGITPAFEFAQSHEVVALNVKFSHKLDTPATLGCTAVTEDLSFPDNKSFVFKADCKAAKKTFVLSMTLHDEVDPQTSSFELTSVGRATITLRKKAVAVWPRLLAQGTKSGKQHVWWAMREKLDKEVENWEKAKKEKEKAEKEAAKAAEASASEEVSLGSDGEVQQQQSNETAPTSASS
jgi:hypothetical protein